MCPTAYRPPPASGGPGRGRLHHRGHPADRHEVALPAHIMDEPFKWKSAAGRFDRQSGRSRSHRLQQRDLHNQRRLAQIIHGVLQDHGCEEYCQQWYNIHIRDVAVQCQEDLRTRGCKPMSLVLELCRVAGLTDQVRSDIRMKALSNHTRLNPDRQYRQNNQPEFVTFPDGDVRANAG